MVDICKWVVGRPFLSPSLEAAKRHRKGLSPWTSLSTTGACLLSSGTDQYLAAQHGLVRYSARRRDGGWHTEAFSRVILAYGKGGL